MANPIDPYIDPYAKPYRPLCLQSFSLGALYITAYDMARGLCIDPYAKADRPLYRPLCQTLQLFHGSALYRRHFPLPNQISPTN